MFDLLEGNSLSVWRNVCCVFEIVIISSEHQVKSLGAKKLQLFTLRL